MRYVESLFEEHADRGRPDLTQPAAAMKVAAVSRSSNRLPCVFMIHSTAAGLLANLRQRKGNEQPHATIRQVLLSSPTWPQAASQPTTGSRSVDYFWISAISPFSVASSHVDTNPRGVRHRAETGERFKPGVLIETLPPLAS